MEWIRAYERDLMQRKAPEVLQYESLFDIINNRTTMMGKANL